MAPSVAIVGMACRYPDACSPGELWENVLAQRRAFRRIPSGRLRLEDYLSPDHRAPDSTYIGEAAVIEGYDFDRTRFRVAGSTFRATDLAHWLALDIAAQALADAGFEEGEGLPRDTTGVILGNTLTGEFSRANLMRLRWPYVRRVVEAALITKGWSAEQRQAFLEELEPQYKAPFPPVGEETLAGSLSNTIAGRICNHFDLKGGGYTVDGACAASLLAVATACSSLVEGDFDVALAGGVDLSLDPFELVGFAKTNALAPEEMRIYDVRSAGFWPGEGCGAVVLMRHDDAVAQHRRIYATIRGWGISSDGSGGITRPEVEGQLLAVQRAYRRAGFGIDTIAFFEGHGTGTEVGDATELQVLSRARRENAPNAPPAAIGSIKANIGHTKAAAGVAGLIKATMALHTQILPPTTGCEEPHPELTGKAPALRVLSEGMLWPSDQPLRASISAMGFGGINSHLVLEGTAIERRSTLRSRDRAILASAQDAELFLLAAENLGNLQRQVDHLAGLALRLSRAELADLAAQLEKTLRDGGVRAAIVAASPEELARRLETLRSWLEAEITSRLDVSAGVFLGQATAAPRIGFLFSGQGSPAHLSGGLWRRRFECVRELYAQANLPKGDNAIATVVAQPAIVTASMAALRVLDQFRVMACVGIGHSLGELTALQWAGAMDEPALLRIARGRGKAMAELGSSTGAMASIRAGHQQVKELLNGSAVVIAGFNSPYQTAISGEASDVASIVARAQASGFMAVTLPVSHAFHSAHVAAAAPVFAQHLARETFQPLQHTVVSTVTGGLLAANEDLRMLLQHQITFPVRFTEAMAIATAKADLFLEVGPGQVLSGLVSEFIDKPVIAIDAGGPSLKGFLHAIGAAFALGATINHEALFADRFSRPFDLDWRPRFFANPCELAPVPLTDHLAPTTHYSQPVASIRATETLGEIDAQGRGESEGASRGSPQVEDVLELMRQLVAERAELPPSAVRDETRLLKDLHLNSITVSQLIVEAARRLGLPPPVSPTDYANATVGQVAQALVDLLRIGSASPDAGRHGQHRSSQPAGVDSWIRAFTVELVERPLTGKAFSNIRAEEKSQGSWRVVAPTDHPLADPLRQAFACIQGQGVILCLPPDPDERHVGLLLEGARAALTETETTHFVLVQHGGGGGAFARTLHLERPGTTTCVVDVPFDHPKAIDLVIAEANAVAEYTEAHYDYVGRRRVPVLQLLPKDEAEKIPFTSADVLLVTGGGKGIAAECALTLAGETGVRLALIGRSQPATDAELGANLERFAAAGIKFRYFSTDITNTDAIQATVRETEAELGPITAILHGAGTNLPQLLTSLDELAFLQTLKPKVQGARNLLAAVNPNRLCFFVAFGSIISRTGLPGEADYAVANEWLRDLAEGYQKEHPHCRCLVVEWSLWSGVGMGERLGRVDALVQAGITPITLDIGISILRRLISRALPSVSVVVAGRFGNPPTLKLDKPDLPFLRFLEQLRIHYPGIELVVDSELSTDTDPYLDDHVYHGERLLPAVMGLEAMAQAAMALVGTKEIPVFEDVTFNRPVVIPGRASTTIRVAALVRESGRVDVVLRSSETAFQMDHFHATCCFEKFTLQHSTFSIPPSALPLIPDQDLYGTVLFQGGRLKRLTGYRLLRATECIAEIKPGDGSDWFGRYLPQTLVLGDAGARDAVIHAIQACIPHATLLPIGVDRLISAVDQAQGSLFVHALERCREGDLFIYDVEVTTADGSVQECWEGLRLRKVADIKLPGHWPVPLLGPYFERRFQELIPGSAISVAVVQNAEADRQARSNQAIQQALGTAVSITKRPDGKPEVRGNGKIEVSVSHAVDLTLAVARPGPIACDIELVKARPASVWQDLLGPERLALAELIAKESGGDLDTAATSVWGATECLKKAELVFDTPLVFLSSTADRWILLSSGPFTMAVLLAPLQGIEERVVIGVLT